MYCVHIVLQNTSASIEVGYVKLGTGLVVRFKGLVHPKMKIMSLISHPHVFPNP